MVGRLGVSAQYVRCYWLVGQVYLAVRSGVAGW